VLDLFREAAAEQGIPFSDDFNGGDNEGVGYFHVNQRRGVRWSTARAFLKPALKRHNLTLWTKGQATRLIIEGRRVTGVEVLHKGRAEFVYAGREVLLSAGAVNSPQLLQLSGIGDPKLLASHGIAAALALPGVGENLQDHLQLRPVFGVEGLPTLNVRANSFIGKVGMGLEYALWRRGPMTMAPSQMGGFTRSSDRQVTPDLQFHVQPLSLDKFGDPLHRFPAFTATVCNVRPRGRGHVRIKSADPREAPAIQPNYLSHRDDSEIAVQAIQLMRRVVPGQQSLCALPTPRAETRPPIYHRCRACDGRGRYRHDHLSPGWNLPDGRRCNGGGRCTA
jgi:choline dehydrogenase